MSYKLVIAEKPSVAQSIAKVIGADKREYGYLEGQDEEIRMINEKLDFYVMEASDEEALKDFWDYCEERQREECIIADMKIKNENKD